LLFDAGRMTPSFSEALRFWVKLGFINFGGPAGQIAIMHTELVEKRRWISEERFLHALNFCMLLPGPEASQLAIYIGWLLHGIRGGLVAGIFFILPAMILLWALSWLYMAGGNLPWVAAIFYGLQPAVIAIVAAALVRLGHRALKTPGQWIVAVLAFAAIFFFHVPFPLILVGAAVAGVINARFSKSLPPGDEESPHPTPRAHVGKVIAIGVTLWILPIVLAGWWRGWNDVLAQQGLFFSKAALITFGGAYAVLPYVAQQAVDHYSWLSTGQMMSGLALAETTPGPLIIVLQFVGFAGAWQHPGNLPPLLAGTLGAAITSWVTFVPSFIFVMAGAPLIERLRRASALTAVLAVITAAVVGVILNLGVWFSLHVFFPAPGKFDPVALVLAAIFFLPLWRGRCGTVPIVAAGAIAGLLLKLGFGL